MSSRLSLLLVLGACGRVGFDDVGRDALVAGDAMVSNVDAPGVLGTMMCPTQRAPITDTNGRSLVVAPARGGASFVAWDTQDGTVTAGTLATTTGALVSVMRLFGAGFAARVVSAYPIASGSAFALETTSGDETLYSVSADLGTVTLRGRGRGGVGRSSLSGFEDYVIWGHGAPDTTRSILFERLDASGVPTLQSNRTTSSEVRDVVVSGANGSHAHLVWANADDTCTFSELFGGIPDLDDVGLRSGCHAPRNAGGVGDAIVTAYSTSTGALRLYALSPNYEHDIELSPDATAPALADDGNVVWATWFDDRVGGALVLAKIELGATSANVTVTQLAGVTPIAQDGVVLVDEASPARLVVLEAGAIATVQPCL